MIGGIVMMLVAIWMYQAAVSAKQEKPILWVVVGTLTFFVAQWLIIHLNIFILESIQDTQDGGLLDDRPLTSVKSDSLDGFSGLMLSLYLELFPPFFGVIAAGLVRMLVILKEPFSMTNIFGGIKETFSSIKNSFKATE